jgi:hydroxymethylglutaryl-CoA lyase
MQLPKQVIIKEVGPRDGFQSIKKFIPSELKAEVIYKLAEAGLTQIQATSFVHPRAIPQLVDAEKVMSLIDRKPGVTYSALVVNLKGIERAHAVNMDEVEFTVSASESHSKANLNADIEQALIRADECIEAALKRDLAITCGISVAFGCPYEGAVPIENVSKIVARFINAGVVKITLADTTGMANPKQVYYMLSYMRDKYPDVIFSLHMHNTRGLALANIMAAMEVGVNSFDAAIAGLGGCPYAPGATGNVSSEDLINMLESMGIATGVDLNKLIDLGKYVEEVISKGESHILRAGGCL